MRLSLAGGLGCLALAASSSWCAAESSPPDDGAMQVTAAEKFVDAFYSFELPRLSEVLSAASGDSRREILFYQGWAQGAHYKVLRRQPCRAEGSGQVQCSITVEDDLMKAMGIPFNVTDTFHLSFASSAITSITTTSDDPPEWELGKAWVRKNRAELIRVPCEGYFDGGPTPGACAEAMVQGLTEFAASPDYPGNR